MPVCSALLRSSSSSQGLRPFRASQDLRPPWARGEFNSKGEGNGEWYTRRSPAFRDDQGWLHWIAPANLKRLFHFHFTCSSRQMCSLVTLYSPVTFAAAEYSISSLELLELNTLLSSGFRTLLEPADHNLNLIIIPPPLPECCLFSHSSLQLSYHLSYSSQPFSLVQRRSPPSSFLALMSASTAAASIIGSETMDAGSGHPL
jgi:hypothetical protein